MPDQSTSNHYYVVEADKIDLKACIGRGGFSDVYKAEHKDWGFVAIKQLKNNDILHSDR